VVPQLAAVWSVHWPVGSVPLAAIGVQVPAVAGSAHDVHFAPQVVRQQTPRAQMPLPHSAPLPHTAPGDLKPHEPALQEAGAAQSASAMQLVLQAAVPQANGAQEVDIGLTQAPAPSQLDAGVKVVPVAGQVAAAQGVPIPYFWQAPAWHLPLVPQLVLPWSLQLSAGSGMPVGTAVHRPIDPVSAQDWQALAQAETQQTPCAQLLDWHSVLVEQNAPFGFSPHELLVQTLPVEQLASAVQPVKQRAPLQAKGAQVRASGAMQFPLASQAEAAV
jgi:hypothetical protein